MTYQSSVESLRRLPPLFPYLQSIVSPKTFIHSTFLVKPAEVSNVYLCFYQTAKDLGVILYMSYILCKNGRLFFCKEVWGHCEGSDTEHMPKACDG